MILGGGAMQAEAFKVARSVGLRTVCVDPNPSAPCVELADHFYAADLADVPALTEVAKQHSVDGVMTLAADYPMPAAARLCATLRLSGPSPEAVATVCNKAELRRATASRFVTSPRWQTFARDTGANVRALLERSACIFKPVDSSGGRGVTLLTHASSDDEVRAAFDLALAASRSGEMLVEEFVEGAEFSVESFTFHGQTTTVAITEKATSGPPFFMEVGHVVPAPLPDEQRRLIERFVAEVVTATGLDNCATHLELKLGSAGPVLIEVAGRLGGGFINTDLVPLATGVNMVKGVIDVALGIAPDLRATKRAGAAIRFLIPPPGVLLETLGVAAAEEAPGTQRVVCEYRPGETIPVVRDATGRKAYVISTGDTPSEARSRARGAENRVVFRMQAA